MAAGIPVLASDAGGIAEALPQSRVFEVGSPLKLVAKLISENQQLDASIAEAKALRKVASERFSTERMVADTLNFYAQLI